MIYSEPLGPAPVQESPVKVLRGYICTPGMGEQCDRFADGLKQYYGEILCDLEVEAWFTTHWFDSRLGRKAHVVVEFYDSGQSRLFVEYVKATCPKTWAALEKESADLETWLAYKEGAVPVY